MNYNTTGLDVHAALMKALSTPGPMTTYSTPTTTTPAPAGASAAGVLGSPLLPAVVGAGLLGLAGYFLMPRHAMMAAVGGAVVGGATGYFAFAPKTA